MVLLILAAVALTVLAGAGAAVEASFSRIGRNRAADLTAQGRRGAAAVAGIAEDPAPVLSVATLLRIAAEVGAVVVVTLVLADLLRSDWVAAVVTVLVMLTVSFVVVGVGPRTVGRQHAEAIALATAPAMLALTRVLYPLARLLVAIGNALTPGEGMPYGPFASEAELRQLVDIAQESRLIEAGEQKMIHSVIDLGDTLTREVMVPRTDVVSVEAHVSLHGAMSLFLRSGFSRVPVVGETHDDVLGILYLKDVARRVHESPDVAHALTVESLMRAPVFVPDSKPIDALLREMQHAGHAAIVIDEYGGTAGLVTIEDILEEIVGEIADEYDVEAAGVEDAGDGVLRVSSRLHVDELGDLFGLELDDEEVDTVGGLLAKALGRVPIAGAKGRVAGLELQAERFEGRRHALATVLVRQVHDADEPVPSQSAGADR